MQMASCSFWTLAANSISAGSFSLCYHIHACAAFSLLSAGEILIIGRGLHLACIGYSHHWPSMRGKRYLTQSPCRRQPATAVAPAVLFPLASDSGSPLFSSLCLSFVNNLSLLVPNSHIGFQNRTGTVATFGISHRYHEDCMLLQP